MSCAGDIRLNFFYTTEGSLATSCGLDKWLPPNDYLFRCAPGLLSKYPEWPTLLYHLQKQLDTEGVELVYNDYRYIYELIKLPETGRLTIGKQRKDIELKHTATPLERARRQRLQDPELPVPLDSEIVGRIPSPTPSHKSSSSSTDSFKNTTDNQSIRLAPIPQKLRNFPLQSTTNIPSMLGTHTIHAQSSTIPCSAFRFSPVQVFYLIFERPGLRLVHYFLYFS